MCRRRLRFGSARGSRHPQYIRNAFRTAQWSAAHVLPACESPLPQWALLPAISFGRSHAGNHLPGLRRAIPRSRSRGARLQQYRRLQDLRRHGNRPDRERGDAGAGRFQDDRRGRGRRLGDAHVVAHEGHRTDDGRANRCAVPRPLAEGKGDRLPRRVEKTSRPLRQSAHAGTVGNGFQLLQRGQFRQELPCQGQGREGNEEAREISQGGRLPGLPWDKALGGRPHAETAGESVWTGQRQ